ncbi:hypothetical protein [Mesorhizobium sp. WSM4311]|nr:hypothetical protein [Mesorhizobium sp. WSM4311]
MLLAALDNGDSAAARTAIVSAIADAAARIKLHGGLAKSPV